MFYSLSSSPPAPSLISYLSLCILQLPGVTVTLRATLTMSQSSPSYSPRPTRYHPFCVLVTLIVTTSYSLSSSPRLTRSHSRYVLLAIVLDASVLIAILLIVVVLIASCCICQLSFVSDTQSNATCVKTALLHLMIAAMGVTLGAFAGNVKCVVAYIDVHIVDIKNRTGLSHYACNPLCVCECNRSICCDVPHLDSQRDHAAMTHVIRTCPVGKCPDTPASRRKMP